VSQWRRQPPLYAAILLFTVAVRPAHKVEATQGIAGRMGWELASNQTIMQRTLACLHPPVERHNTVNRFHQDCLRH
jgi:hypothetical protein